MIEAAAISARGLAGVAISAALALLVLAPSVAATAAPLPPRATGGRVRLLQPGAVSPRARRCLTRLREELEAGGFEVAISEFAVGGEALWTVEPPSPRDGSLATITLIGNPDEGAAELWIVNGVPWGRAVVRRLLVPAGAGIHDDEVLAIRALEFLRASALDLAGTRPPAPATSTATTTPTGSTPPASTTPTPTSTSTSTTNPSASSPTVVAAADATAASPEPEPRSMALDLGLSVLKSAPDLDPAFLPVARLRAEWLSLLETRLTVAGFGTQPRVSRPQGSAAVGHVLALAELRAAFRHGRAVRPAIGVGVGVLRVKVDATGNPSYEGTGGQRWAALFDVGAGLTVRLGGRFSLAFEVHGQLAEPYPTVRFLGEEAARVARPALFSSVTLVTAL